MADSRRSAGGVAPSSFFVPRFRPSRITPYDLPGLHRSTLHDPPLIGPSEVPHRRSIHYRRSTQYGLPPRRSTQYGPSRRSTQYGPPAIGPSEVPSCRSTQGISLRPAMDSASTPYGAPAYDLPANLRRSAPAYDLPANLRWSAPYDPPNLRRSAPAYDLPANIRWSAPYDPPNLRRSAPAYDLPANLRWSTPYDPPAIGCHSTPPDTPSPVCDIPKDNIGYQCALCGEKGIHFTLLCPFLTLAAQLDVVKDNPPIEWKFYQYAVREGTDGYGVGFYNRPKEGAVEKSAADAMRLYKSGLNLIRITSLPENNRDPKRLCRQLEKKIGPVAHATVFPDQRFGFVKFVSRDSAKKAIEVLNYSDCGHLTWAMQRPE